jgi:hypothetical protein
MILKQFFVYKLPDKWSTRFYEYEWCKFLQKYMPMVDKNILLDIDNIKDNYSSL